MFPSTKPLARSKFPVQLEELKEVPPAVAVVVILQLKVQDLDADLGIVVGAEDALAEVVRIMGGGIVWRQDVAIRAPCFLAHSMVAVPARVTYLIRVIS